MRRPFLRHFIPLILLVGIVFLGGRANSAGPMCESLFALSQTEGTRDYLTELSQYLSSLPDGGEHKVEIKNGKGYVKIGRLDRNQYTFQRLLLRGIKAGSVAEVDGGNVIGPKVVNLLSRLRKIPTDTGEPFVLRGTLHVDVVLATAKDELEGSKSGRIDSNKPEFWSDADVSDFGQATKDLKLVRACMSVYRVLSLADCGPMGFEMNSGRPNEIRWFQPVQEDAGF